MTAPLIDLQALVEAVAERTAAKVLAALKDREVPESHDEDVWLTVPEAASHLKRSRQSLDLLRTTGKGPRFQKFGRQVRYRRSWLDEWGQEHHNTLYGEREGA